MQHPRKHPAATVLAFAAMVALSLSLSVAGCGRSSIVVAEVTLFPGYDGAGILQIDVDLELDGATENERFPAMTGDPITFPASFAVSLARDRTGTLILDVNGLAEVGGQLTVVATGSADVEIDQHHSTEVTIEITPFCGNGVTDPVLSEECDDGADNSDSEPDACRSNCVAASCGDDVVDTGEACDDGPDNSDTDADACRSSCVAATCGDAVVDTGEACDDGSSNSDTAPDACRLTCVTPTCGDGVADTGEDCDDGAGNSDTAPDACRTTCAAASCGDGVLDTGETCDDGAANSDTAPDACRTTCVPASCGDGVIDGGNGEICDNGMANSDTAADACRTTCLPATCGDNVTDTGEDCDDGNTVDGDQCGHSCLAPAPIGPTVDLGVTPAAFMVNQAADVATSGDFDGDGLADLVFGIPGSDSVYVLLGIDMPAAPTSLDITVNASITFTGAAASGLGLAVAAGDADGDGLDELLLGANDAAHLYLGTTLSALSFPAVVDVQLGADVDVTLPVGVGGGAALAMGDVSSDGLDDLIFGMPLADPGILTDAGRVDVVLGRDFAGLGVTTVDVDASAELRVLGAADGDLFGSTLAAGDYDGDLDDELAAGAPGADGAGDAIVDAGEVYLLAGRALTAGAATTTLDLALSEFEIVFTGGPDPMSMLGSAIALADLDGNGQAELIAAAPDFDPGMMVSDAGMVVALTGVPLVLGAGVVQDLVSGAEDLSIARGGGTDSDRLGAALATGDVNNDGFADLLLGEPGSDAVAVNAGIAYLWLGRAFTPTLTVDLDVTPAEVMFLPEMVALDFGEVVVVADVNDDGFDDVVVGGAGIYSIIFGGADATP